MSLLGHVRLASSRKLEWEKTPIGQQCGREEDAVGLGKDHLKELVRLVDYRRWKCEVHVKECTTLEQLVDKM